MLPGGRATVEYCKNDGWRGRFTYIGIICIKTVPSCRWQHIVVMICSLLWKRWLYLDRYQGGRYPSQGMAST